MTGILRIVSLTGEAAFSVGRSGGLFFRGFYRFVSLAGKTASRSWLLVKNPDLTIAQMFGLGIESLALVTVIAIFLGTETVIQAVYQMSGIIPMRYLGVLVCKTMITELGPVITAMVIAGRVATGIAAEIGSMKTTEQLDAMQVLRLDPIRYLIVPRTVACVVMLPVLVIWAELVGFLSSIVTVLLTVDVTLHSYLSGLRLFFAPIDLFVGIFKTMVFGAILSLTGAYFGFEAKPGAEGVGEATTKAVIVSAILILIFDFIIAVLVL
ncbi:MAG: ABC transporter permease [Chitinispirillaceae bacterium]|nr:ABC transporter permease [Chitinispirillaceae bacterium]